MMSSPTWTKHDYEFFAEVLHNTPMSDDERILLKNTIGDAFVADNPRFDWGRWNAAVYEGELTHRGGTAKYGNWHQKTYVMTADILLDAPISEDTRVALISAFGAAFERDNPNFNWEKFRKAAGSPYAPASEQEWDDVSKALHEQEFGSARSCPTCGGGMYKMGDRYTCVNCGATMGEYQPRAPMRRVNGPRVHVHKYKRQARPRPRARSQVKGHYRGYPED